MIIEACYRMAVLLCLESTMGSVEAPACSRANKGDLGQAHKGKHKRCQSACSLTSSKAIDRSAGVLTFEAWHLLQGMGARFSAELPALRHNNHV